MAEGSFAPSGGLEESTGQELLPDDDHDSSSYDDPSLMRFCLVVVGAAGQGKSTLINGLLGHCKAKEGDKFDAGTTDLENFKFKKNGVLAEIWDTPGFGMDGRKEKSMVKTMAQEVKEVDLLLYCIKMDEDRWPRESDQNTIAGITKAFGKDVWSHCLFVLTFANRVVAGLLEEFDESDLESEFSKYCSEWKQRIHQKLQELVGLSHDEVSNVGVVPVGWYKRRRRDNNQWELPDRDDWFISFWIQCKNHVQEDSVTALCALNLDRFVSPTDLHGVPHETAIEREVLNIQDKNADDDSIMTGSQALAHRRLPVQQVFQREERALLIWLDKTMGTLHGLFPCCFRSSTKE